MGGSGVSATALTLAAVLALAADPRCGAALDGTEFQARLAAIAIHESGGDPLIIGVNADRARGLPAAAIHSATSQEAAAQAAALLAQGRSIDLGLMQVNSGQLAHHGLTLEAAFDACKSMSAGADHYADDVRTVWTLAHRRYNTGSTERGAAYAAGVEQVLNRIQASGEVGASVPGPLGGNVPVLVQPLPPPPASWDVYGQARATHGQAAAAYSFNRVAAAPVAPAPLATPGPVPGSSGLVLLRADTNRKANEYR